MADDDDKGGSLSREALLLLQYAGGVREHRRALLGTGLVIAILWLADHYGKAVLAEMVPRMPWLTANRLLWLSITFVLTLAQYLTWRSLSLKYSRLVKASREITPAQRERISRLKEGFGQVAVAFRVRARHPDIDKLLDQITGEASALLEYRDLAPAVLFVQMMQSRLRAFDDSDDPGERNGLWRELQRSSLDYEETMVDLCNEFLDKHPPRMAGGAD